MSPMMQRRLAVFRSNRRAFWSLWLFLILFIASLGAEFLANDRPILIRYQGNFYFPVLADYPESTFGGSYPTPDYQDPWLIKRINADGFMIWPPIRFDYTTSNRAPGLTFPSAPSTDNWLGTDDMGRDVLARLIYGMRISILFGLGLTLISSVIGVAAGAVQGYFGGWVDLLAQRFLEIWSGLPQLFILIIVASVIVPGFWSLLAILVLFSWTSLVGVVRAEFLRARNFDYVRAARALGMGNIRIMTRHILPNAMVATLTFAPFILSGSIVALTSLDFLGLGLPPGSASLGDLLRQGKENLQAPWLGAAGFIIMALLLSLLIFIGEGVRDAFDPRKNNN